MLLQQIYFQYKKAPFIKTSFKKPVMRVLSSSNKPAEFFVLVFKRSETTKPFSFENVSFKSAFLVVTLGGDVTFFKGVSLA